MDSNKRIGRRASSLYMCICITKDYEVQWRGIYLNHPPHRIIKFSFQRIKISFQRIFVSKIKFLFQRIKISFQRIKFLFQRIKFSLQRIEISFQRIKFSFQRIEFSFRGIKFLVQRIKIFAKNQVFTHVFKFAKKYVVIPMGHRNKLNHILPLTRAARYT